MGEYPKEFIGRVQKLLSAVGVKSKEKIDLASYQLSDVPQVCTLNRRRKG